ncbi:MAG: TlpA family protein disulfide reductase [Anaerolineales bacterium]|jgi:peroxiredoxin|uniref:TlpA family protein disulfide reductase n=1 Tax=Candidatus Villigracilis vicinus TaxID=3140679 RepID=UPI00313704AA|nr:TlpA family protein disulfide reductase [Anaerolineales bacterium]MBK7451794.1 TlpA family protein disulfide reductase [Anaerolineales bacterium]MBK9781525.1 TlpA family protein disulfide reductase [Anaerolineales bacterium]
MKKHQKYRKQRQSNSILPFIIGGGLILLGLALIGVLQKPADASAADSVANSVVPVKVDFPAPALVLENVRGGTESLTDFGGQVVLVNNWATWCPPCKAEMPSLQKYYQSHHEQGFTIVAVNAGDTKSKVDQFVSDYSLTFNVWLDPNGAALDAFKNGSLPSSYVLDRSGIVRYAWTGEISYEMLEKYITPVIQETN